ncbi:MAG: NYN domain-containing protein [Acidovorax sp.]|nr:MAG: NYN domain-containing protein [Acidovorax sp.]
MIAFFIDADNLCSSTWVDEACRLLDAEGHVSLRRAYGSAEKLKGLAEVLRTRLIRPYVNLSLSKNTTDVALAIDAMEASYATPRPTAIAIGSGDADFVPLVLRLRERGFQVLCTSHKGKMAPEAVCAYDKVIFVGEGDAVAPQPGLAVAAHDEEAVVARPAAAEKKVSAKKVATKKVTSAAKVSGSTAVAKKAPAKKAAAVAKKSTSNKGDAENPKPVTVAEILKHAPPLKSGAVQPLGEIAKLLHDAKLLGKNAASTKLFKKFPHRTVSRPAAEQGAVHPALTLNRGRQCFRRTACLAPAICRCGRASGATLAAGFCIARCTKRFGGASCNGDTLCPADRSARGHGLRATHWGHPPRAHARQPARFFQWPGVVAVPAHQAPPEPAAGRGHRCQWRAGRAWAAARCAHGVR